MSTATPTTCAVIAKTNVANALGYVRIEALQGLTYTTKANKSCKRARCKKFARGTCTVQSCSRAHEGDEYPNIVHAGHVAKSPHVQARPMKKKAAKALGKVARDGTMNKTNDGEMMGLSQQIQEMGLDLKRKRTEADDGAAAGKKLKAQNPHSEEKKENEEDDA